jgi:hypothetical protein
MVVLLEVVFGLSVLQKKNPRSMLPLAGAGVLVQASIQQRYPGSFGMLHFPDVEDSLTLDAWWVSETDASVLIVKGCLLIRSCTSKVSSYFR